MRLSPHPALGLKSNYGISMDYIRI